MLRHVTLLRLRWLPLAVMLLTAPLVTVGVVRLQTDSSGFVQWLPDNQQDKQEYLQFVELFGGDDYVLATWPGAGLNDARLDKVTAGLREADARRVAAGEPPLIDHINSGNSVYRELISDPLNLAPEEAIQRLQGILVGPDGETTGVIIQTTPAGKIRQQEVIGMVRQVVEDADGIPAEELRLGGTIFEAVAIEQATERSLRDFALPILLITLALTWWCFRSVPLTLIVLSCAVYCRSVSLALVYFTGNTLSPVLVVMPVLIYVLTISGAVHLVNYYRDALRTGSGAKAPLEALKAGWLPCSMAAATTAIGLSSLAVSGIGPVRAFGVYSGVSLLIAITFLLAFLPAALTFLRTPKQPEAGADTADSTGHPVTGERNTAPAAADEAGSGDPSVTAEDRLLAELGGFSPEEISASADPHADAPWHEKMSTLVLQWHHVIISFCVLLVTVLGVGLLQTETTVELNRMFSPDSEILRNYEWIEQHFGPLVPVEATITFPADHPADMLARLELVDAAEQLMRETPQINGTMSAATFVPPVPRATGFQSAVSRRIFGIRVEKQRDRMVEERFLAAAGDQEVWRITARVPTFTEVDYAEFRAVLQQQIGDLIVQRELAQPEEIRVGITGLLPLIDTAQRQLLEDLVESFLLAVLLICPVMMFVLRGVLAGLLAMLPNVIPVIVIFGGMGWLGLRIDVGAVLTASVALGIAVDDTLHVLTWYARAIREGLDRTAAIQVAYSRCTIAMTQTTIICGLGLLVLTLSSFVPTAQFAWLILVLLAAALVGDLILLPALLVGPAGQLMIRGLVQSQSAPVASAASPDPAIGSGE